MKICPCGDLIQDEGTICSRCAALHVLDLPASATEVEVRATYRQLAERLQPEHFPDDEKLKAEAEEKLKDITSAFDYLCSTVDQRGAWRPPSRSEDLEAPSSWSQAQEDPEAAAHTLKLILEEDARLRRRKALQYSLVVAVLIALLLGRYAWIVFGPQGSTGQGDARDRQGAIAPAEGPRERFLAAVQRDLHRFGASDSTKSQPAPSQAAPETSQQAKKIDGQHADQASKAPKIILHPYVTVGSTRDEVLYQQGPPTSASDDKLIYGKSELYLKDGAVIGWRIDPSSPLRVKIWPSTAVDPGQSSYTVGSTKDEVLTVQGTPTAFTEDRFEYGKSVVNFRNNRVVSWKEDPDSTALWAK